MFMLKRLAGKRREAAQWICRKARDQLRLLSIACVICCFALLLVPTKTPRAHHVLENIVRTTFDVTRQMKEKIQLDIARAVAEERQKKMAGR